MNVFDNKNFYIGSIVQVSAIGFLGALGILVLIITVVIQAQWFDENILSPQGQLTNMLPVSSMEIVLSKIFVAMFWSLVIIGVSIGIASVFMANTDMFKEIVTSVTQLSKQNNVHISFSGVVVSVSLCVATAITGVITLCFFAQSFGQMFNGFRNLFSFFSFVLMLAATLFVEYKVMSSLGMLDLSAITAGKDMTEIIGFVISIVKKCSIMNLISIMVYWLLTSTIMRTHLNLL
jgi:hypothetical protein